MPIPAYTYAMDKTPVYILIKSKIDDHGTIIDANVGVTFSIHDAEAHKSAGIENDFQTLDVDANWRETAETSAFALAMRDLRGIVEDMQAEALR